MAATDLEGTWQGVWKRPAADAPVALVLKHATRHDINAYGATLYLLDEPGLHLTLNQAKLSNGNFTCSGFSGQYSATISAGGDALTGIWKGDSEQEMNFTRADDGPALTATFNARPTEADLQQYIDTVHTNSILVARNATGFHLKARLDLFDATKNVDPVPAGYVDIDELWQGPLSWKLTVRDDGGTFTEIDDGSTAESAITAPAYRLPATASAARWTVRYSPACPAAIRPPAAPRSVPWSMPHPPAAPSASTPCR
jgi:hypothetical protein